MIAQNEKSHWNMFNGSNFQSWKEDTISILQAKRCYAVTLKGIDPRFLEDSDESESSSSSSSDEENKSQDEDTKVSKKRKKSKNKKEKRRSPYKDSKARMIIRSHLSESIKSSLTGLTTAKEMWDALIERYESTDYLSQCACLSRLYSERYKSGTSMGTHINTMRSMWTEVNSKWKDSKKCNQDP
jgi:hypothetical protein